MKEIETIKNTKIGDTSLSPASRIAIESLGIKTVSELLETKISQIAKIKGCGKTRLLEIKRYCFATKRIMRDWEELFYEQ